MGRPLLVGHSRIGEVYAKPLVARHTIPHHRTPTAIIDIAAPPGIYVHDHIHHRQERSRKFERTEADLAVFSSGGAVLPR
jgi:hypothetical protein